MNRKKKQHIIELAMMAPNVDNSQPFYFRWEDERLLIFRDEERDRQRGNAGNYVSMVGLGCLVECVVIAANGEGFETKVDFQYDRKNQNASWVMTSFQPNSTEPDELLHGLKLRCSDRREYQGGDLSYPVFEQVSADIAQFKKCDLYFQDPSNQKLIDYILQCEEFFWKDKLILPEMLSWVRWSQQEVRRTRDGMPWESLGVNYVTSRLMKLVARSERFRRLARRSGGPLRTQQKNVDAHIRSSAALGCITVQKAQPETMFQLGRLFLRIWVRLNLAGFGVQVIANPAIHAFQYVIGILPEDYPKESKQVFAEGLEVLTEAFGIPEGEIPAWMFRTGKSSPLPARMKTPRLPLSSVIKW